VSVATRRGERRAILCAYPDPSPLRRLYRRLRLARGGYDAIEALLPRDGLVVDLGCGEGLLAHVLARRAAGRSVLAIDHDGGRIARLSRSVAALSIVPRCASLVDVPLPTCDAVLLVDVLHYFDRAAQEAVVERAFAALRPGGTLLLREPDAALTLRMAWNRLHERLFTFLRFTRAHIGAYRTSGAWTTLLAHAGFVETTAHPVPGFGLYADRVVTGRKPS